MQWRSCAWEAYRWYKVRVEQQVDVRSHDLRTEVGRVFRRNRRHLSSSKEPADHSCTPVPINIPHGVSPVKSSTAQPATSQAVQSTKEIAEANPPEKPNSDERPAAVPVPSTPVKPVNLTVTHSGRISRAPSHLKATLNELGILCERTFR